MDNKYIIVTDADIKLSQVKNDCTDLCVPTTKGESLFSILNKICSNSGKDGQNGQSGYSGISGFSGQDGAAIYSGYSGYSAQSGNSGYSGYSGGRGISGYSGYSGRVGNTGTSGFSGSATSGYSGYSSSSGYSGYSGLSGGSGFSGYSGRSGFSGYIGPTGSTGSSGFSGYSATGTSGFSGPSGYSGYSGKSGWTGYSGYSGRSGFSGSGVSGYSGLGLSGYSGYTGISGYSGAGVSGWSGYSGQGAQAFFEIFNDTTDWGSPSGGLYCQSFTHNLNSFNLVVEVWDITGTSAQVLLDTIEETSANVMTICVTQTPDNRFAGRIVINGSAASGWSGYSGQNGVLGGDGVSGYSGYSGSGFSGYSGRSGYSGYSGAGSSGFSGYSGKSGYSGYSGPSGFSGYSGLDGGNAGKIYYLDPLDNSDIATYFTALPSPSPNAETTLALGATGTGDTLLASFATDPNDPGVLSFPAGTSFRHYYVKTGAANEVARIKTEVYICNFDGSGETLIKSGYTDNFSDTPIQFLVTNYVDNVDYAMTLTQRLVFKLYVARVSGPATANVTVYFDGTSHASSVQTPITVGTPGVSGYSGYSSQSGFSGYSAASGFSGYSGKSGYSGYSGLGLSGFSGYSGTAGSAGTSGFSGYSGSAGGAGASGFSGYSSVGTSGFSGYSGAGISGFSGYSGGTGSNGSSGFSGYSGAGASGFSGYTGYSGYNAAGYYWSSLSLPTMLLPAVGDTPTFTIGTGLAYSANQSIVMTEQGNTAYFTGNVISYNAGTGSMNVSVTFATGGSGPFSGWYINLAGKAGQSGYSGYSGGAGGAGSSGFSGYSGAGTSGFSGYSGGAGSAGSSGFSGYSGAGISGFSGYSATSGFSGYSGPSGYSGYSGVSGYSGYSGKSGYSGYTGYSGYSSTSGYSGYSSTSGFSGYSGGTSGFSGYSGAGGGAAGYTSTATAAGTTTLTSGSNYDQYFTGATTQTVVMPDATTLSLGAKFHIVNNSTGVVTVNQNGGTLIVAMQPSTELVVTVTNIGSAAGTWSSSYSGNIMIGGSCALASNFTTSSVTAVSTNLTFAVLANEVYDVVVEGTCSKATSATGLKFAIAAPASSVIKGEQYGGGATLAAAQVPSLITTINTLGTTLATGTGIEVTFLLTFRIKMSSTAGNVTFQAATVTSNVATVYAGTRMTWTKATEV